MVGGVGALHVAPVTWLFGSDPQDQGAATLGSAAESAQSFNEGVESDAAVRLGELRKVSMYGLARRRMSSNELREYLLADGFLLEQVDGEIARLEGVGLLDDSSLAESIVHSLRERKGLGRGGLIAELRRRKLNADAIDEAIADNDFDGTDGGELARATEVAYKRASQLRALDATTAKRRLSAFLMRRGYTGSVVSTAVARALAPDSGPVFR